MNLSDLLNYVPVVGQFKSGYESGKRNAIQEAEERKLLMEEKQAKLEALKKEIKNKSAPIGSFYDVPSAEEETKIRELIDANKKRWNEARSQFVGPLEQQEQAGYDLSQMPYKNPREEFKKQYGYSPDLTMDQFKTMSEAKENLAQAKYYESGGSKAQPKNRMAVSGGYVSQEFIDNEFPELAGQDIPFQELNQRLINKRADLTRNKPPWLGNEQINLITGLESSITKANNLKKKFLNMLNKDNLPIDPIYGRFSILVQKYGFEDNAEMASLKNDIVAQWTEYLKEISGSQVTGGEADRLNLIMPRADMTITQFATSLDNFIDRLNVALNSRMNVLRKAGYRTGGFTEQNQDQTINKSGQGASTESVKTKGQPVLKKDAKGRMAYVYPDGTFERVK